MQTTASLVLIALLFAEPTVTTIPILQLFLGAVGLCTMISYARCRLKIRSRYESGGKEHAPILLLRHASQWLGEHHHAAGHARVAGK